MTKNSEKFEIPGHLFGMLNLHTQLSKCLKVGYKNLSSIEIDVLKKKKLAVKTAILSVSIRFDSGPPITEISIFPLSEDTLGLLETKIESELREARKAVNETSPDVTKLSSYLRQVKHRLQKKQSALVAEAA